MPRTSATAHRRRQRATGRKDETIRVRASADTKAVLDRAAALRGQTLSEFMLESARHRAEEIILDQRVFLLDPEAHERFLALLDASARPSVKQSVLLTRKAPWEN
jgi:uncharacterized protein (DUF1778 family)